MESLESSSVCLDTSVLIDDLRGRKQTVEFLRGLEENGASLSTTTVNSFELYYGAYRSAKRDKNVAATKLLLRRLLLLELTVEASEEAGRIQALLEKAGVPLNFRDVLIGAITKTHRMMLVTRDTRNFLRIPDLAVKEAP